MNLFGWLKRDRTDDALATWRREWTTAIDEARPGDVEALRAQLDAQAASGADVEVELEMLDALEQLRLLRQHGAALPTVDTQHRVIGNEPCHFTAPASLPDDQAQVSGRLLATPTRAVFVGGGRTSAVPWHTVHRVARIDRDVILARRDGTAAARFRLNTYGDALALAFLAAHFTRL